MAFPAATRVTHEPVAHMGSTPPMTATGFNVIGHITGNLGLGVSVRNVLAILQQRGFPVAALDLDPGAGRGGLDLQFADVTVAEWSDLPHAINLFVLTPSTMEQLLRRWRDDFERSPRLNVLWTWWELPVLPPHWLPLFGFMDALVAPSDHIRHALGFAVSGTRIVSGLNALDVPAGISPARERFGFAAGDIVFVTGFEFASDPVRKNTDAVIAAFRRAFSGNPAARLVVKVNNPSSAAARQGLDRLQALAGGDPRIRFLTEAMTYPEVLTLYASADVYVSLHRAEGLGLGPMEAMALGTPVIATGWSGNMTYMDSTSAALVDYTLVPVDGSIPVYSSKALAGLGARWAAPDVDMAAQWMQALAADADLRRSLGARGAEAIARFNVRAREGRFADELLALLAQHAQLGLARRGRPALRDVLEAWRDQGLSPLGRWSRQAARTFDRHVGWRLRRAQTAQK